MRMRIINGGIGNLQEHEVLEYLLYSFIPRKDTNAIAHTLIKEFGSLYEIFNAKPEFLQAVSGMTENASLFLSVMGDIIRNYGTDTSAQSARTYLITHGEVKEYLGSNLAGLNEERFYAVALDGRNKIVGEKVWNSGNRASVNVSVSDIVRFAQAAKAVSVLIAHNHPTGRTTPSGADVKLTRQIYEVFSALGIVLQDHLIFGENIRYCYSFEESGCLKKFDLAMEKAKEVMWQYD